MRILRILSALAIALCAVSCGGGGSSNGGSSTSASDLTGVWIIQLSENQAQLTVNDLNYPPPAPTISAGSTQVGISLVQSGGVLSAQPSLPAWNPGCFENGNPWWFTGGWQPQLFTFSSGTIVNGNINISFAESNTGSSQAHGTIVLTGSLQSDGSLAGTLTDSCIANPASTGTWSAKRTASLPTN